MRRLYPLNKAKDEKLLAVYARLPTVECRGLCQKACGVIMMTRLEYRRLANALGQDLDADPGVSLACPVLTDEGRCGAYPQRPLICRLFGLTKALACPHGCQPSRWLSDDEAGEFIGEVSRISGDDAEHVRCSHNLIRTQQESP